MKSPNIELLNAGISQGVRRICLSLPTAALSGEEASWSRFYVCSLDYLIRGEEVSKSGLGQKYCKNN